MPRALAIVKYVPAVLCGLLVVAWVVRFSGEYGIQSRQGDIAIIDGSLSVWIFQEPVGSPGVYAKFIDAGISVTARLILVTNAAGAAICLYIPIPLILSFLLPIAAATTTRFRFPLWSYFAWTALLAAELAYYLR